MGWAAGTASPENAQFQRRDPVGYYRSLHGKVSKNCAEAAPAGRLGHRGGCASPQLDLELEVSGSLERLRKQPTLRQIFLLRCRKALASAIMCQDPTLAHSPHHAYSFLRVLASPQCRGSENSKTRKLLAQPRESP